MKRKSTIPMRWYKTSSGHDYMYGYDFSHTTNLGKCIYNVYIVDLNEDKLNIVTMDFYADKNKEIEEFLETIRSD